MTETRSIPTPEDRAEARRKFEARKLTLTGPVWPVRREEMRHPMTVMERMRDDLAALGGTTSLSMMVGCLSSLGWPENLIDCEGASVIDELRFRPSPPEKSRP